MATITYTSYEVKEIVMSYAKLKYPGLRKAKKGIQALWVDAKIPVGLMIEESP